VKLEGKKSLGRPSIDRNNRLKWMLKEKYLRVLINQSQINEHLIQTAVHFSLL
jgi:hypothetical protein